MNYRSHIQEEFAPVYLSGMPKECAVCGVEIEEQHESFLYECEHCMNLQVE